MQQYLKKRQVLKLSGESSQFLAGFPFGSKSGTPAILKEKPVLHRNQASRTPSLLHRLLNQGMVKTNKTKQKNHRGVQPRAMQPTLHLNNCLATNYFPVKKGRRTPNDPPLVSEPRLRARIRWETQHLTQCYPQERPETMVTLPLRREGAVLNCLCSDQRHEVEQNSASRSAGWARRDKRHFVSNTLEGLVQGKTPPEYVCRG